MKKTLEKSIKQNLKIYATDEGLLIVQGPAYNQMMFGFFFAMFALLLFMGAFNFGSYVYIGFSVILLCIAISLFTLRKEVSLNSTKRTFSVQLIFLGLPIFKFSEQSFLDPLLKIYDSEVTYGHVSSDDSRSTCKLQIMTAKGFENVFTFNSVESAYGFRKAILKMDKEFLFEPSAS